MKNIIGKYLRLSLSVKITIYFVIFGLLIGYITFILYTIGATKNEMDLAYETAVPIFHEITGTKGDDFIAELVNRKNDDLTRLYNIVMRTTFSKYGTIRPTIYYLNRNSNKWNRIYSDAHAYFREEPVSADEVPDLDRAIREKLLHSSRLFFGQSDRVSIKVLLPLRKATHAYVLNLEMNREGITTFIFKNVHRILIFAGALLLISVLLGKLFAYRIAKPIMDLSEVARERAEGNISREFTMNRSDEIGVLSDSLNVMTSRIDAHVREIEHRMKTMETMNKIDKAVLSSISRSDLLDRVIGLVSSLFHSSSTAMALYNEEKKGFDLLSRFQGIVQGIMTEKPFVPINNIGTVKTDRVRRVFQFNLQQEEAPYREMLEELLGIKNGTGVNVPVIMAEHYLGSLVMIRDDHHGFSPMNSNRSICWRTRWGSPCRASGPLRRRNSCFWEYSSPLPGP
jgi:HAMP domain-containing protein